MTPKIKRIIILAVACLAILGVGAMLAIGLTSSRSPRVTSSGHALVGGPFTLVATDGATVSDQTYRGKWQILYFGYTFCPDACPMALTNLSVALQKLGPDAGKLQVLFVTVDPKRDTREVMAEYLKSFDSRIVGLTGTEDQIENMAQAYRVSVVSHKTDGGDYLVDHSAFLLVMDPHGSFAGVLGPDQSGEEIADRMRKAMNNPSG